MHQRCLVVGLINTLDHVGKITSNLSSRPTTEPLTSIPTRITNMASGDSDDDILASIIVYF